MKNEMETMKISKLGIKMSIPIVISMISIALYQIVDTMFISEISDNALTMISLCIPVISIITAISLGTSIGVNSLLARTLGEKNEAKSKDIISNSIIVTFFSWILTLIIVLLFTNVFFSFFSNNADIQNLGSKYLLIVGGASIGIYFQILLEKILEAYGKSKLSMLVQFSGAVINLILDPIFIFGLGFIPKLGVIGAAISTVIGQIFGMVLGIIFIVKEKIFSFKKFNFKLDNNILKDIYKVGVPTMFLEAASSFITLILNKVLIEFSLNAVSVWGIYSQLQKFVIIIVYGLNYGMIPIVAYNYGAKNKERINECISFFLKLAILVTFIGMLLFMIIPKSLITIYNTNSELIDIAIPAFRILSLSFIFASISLVRSATFQAFGNGFYSLIINLSRQVIFVVPFIFLLKKWLSINAIWISFVIAEVITMIIATILNKKCKDKYLKF